MGYMQTSNDMRCTPDKATARAWSHVARGSPSLAVFVRARAYLSTDERVELTVRRRRRSAKKIHRGSGGAGYHRGWTK
jgi:hypothetical protein